MAGFVDFQQMSAAAVRRRQPAGSVVPLVLSLEGGIEIESLSAGTGAGRLYRSFVSGLMPGHASTVTRGPYRCVQVYLSPIAVRRLTGHGASALSGGVHDAVDVVPSLAGPLLDRLAEARTPDERLDLVESALIAQLASVPGSPDALSLWLWSEIRRSGGRARIASLVAETGFSHRHVTARFRAATGLTPKALSGIVRFEGASRDLPRLGAAAASARHGYADQAHLARAVRRYAGETASAFAAARRPTAWTAIGLA